MKWLDSLDLEKMQFMDTKNPLFAWQRISRCHQRNEPLPKWVMEYLIEVADGILTIDNPKNQAAKLIKDALGFSDGKLFSQYHKSAREFRAYNRVESERWNRPRGERDYNIYEDIAEKFGVGPDTIKNWYYKVKKLYDDYAEIDREEWIARLERYWPEFETSEIL